MIDRTVIAAGWKALLYMPAHNEKFTAKAPQCGADVVILDLEDSVGPDSKGAARAALPAAIPPIKAAGIDVLVRINRPLDLAVPDTTAAIAAGADGLLVAKTDGPSHVRLLDELVTRLEDEADRRVPAVLSLLIEDLPAFFELRATLAASPRVCSVALGGEDLSALLGCPPDSETLDHARRDMILAASAAGIAPFGLMGSLADFSDLDGLKVIAERSRAAGFSGSTCIHPKQVPVLKAAFMPNDADIARAEAIVAAFEGAQAAGKAAIEVDGQMVDPPVAARAARLLKSAGRLADPGI